MNPFDSPASDDATLSKSLVYQYPTAPISSKTFHSVGGDANTMDVENPFLAPEERSSPFSSFSNGLNSVLDETLSDKSTVGGAHSSTPPLYHEPCVPQLTVSSGMCVLSIFLQKTTDHHEQNDGVDMTGRIIQELIETESMFLDELRALKSVSHAI